MSYLIGKTLADRYRVEEYLGEGGMAQVYRVWDVERAAPLAIKLLRPDLSQDLVFLRRFRRESETLHRLQHPNIVRTYGLEQDDLHVFLLMDYIEGSNLRAEIFRSQGRPISAQRILDVLRPVVSALHYAHRMGLAHCDVKPANILLERGGRVLLSDFGVARTIENATAMTFVSAGTPAYMAPEQIRGEDPTPATDVYALGVVLYEMFSGGERPFTGERARSAGSTSDRVRWEHQYLNAPLLRRLNPDLSPQIEAVVDKCLAKDPRRRFAGALELLKALEAALPVTARQTVNTQPARPARQVSATEASPSPSLQSTAILPVKPVASVASRFRRRAWIFTPIAAILLGFHWLSSLFSR